MSIATRPRYTIEEYVRIEEYSNLKHEYLDGHVWAMAGGTPEHARLSIVVAASFASQLRGKRCAVYSSDARVRVVATGLDTYPDVTIVCGGEQRDAGDPLALVNPIVLVEVTSDSTEPYDRGEKRMHYEQIDTLRELLIVSHREPCLEVFRRGDDGVWTKAGEARAGASVVFGSIPCTLAVDEIYQDPFAT